MPPDTDCKCKLEVLRLLRAVHGLSLKAAADRAEISPTYLQKLERGQVKSPSPHLLYRLAETYEYPYAELMKLAGYPDPKPATRRVGARKQDDRLNALAVAVGNADLQPEEADFLARSLRGYREARRGGVEIPADFVSSLLKTFRQIHATGVVVTREDVSSVASVGRARASAR
jgi:transcriptional regulator with XRE-family HTH domain